MADSEAYDHVDEAARQFVQKAHEKNPALQAENDRAAARAAEYAKKARN